MRTLSGALALLVVMSTSALAQPGYPPIPPPQDEPPPPPAPGARYVLVPGHWHWNGVTYDRWVHARWVIRRAGWGHFVPGAWVQRPNGSWRWVPEHWVP
jgi:hypothetical protein